MVWTTRLATSASAVILVTLLFGDSLGFFAQSRALQEGIVAAAAPSAPAPVAAIAATEITVRVVTESETIVEEEDLASAAESQEAAADAGREDRSRR